MKRTGAGVLLAAGSIGLVVGFLVNQLLTAGGRPTFTPSLMLPVLLIVLGAVTVALAVPIRRATAGGGRVDPFHAVRIAMLARASSIVGAAVTGVAAGLLAFLLTRPVPPSLGSTGAVIAAAAGGLLLVVAGLVAEHLCTIRKDDDDDQPGPADPGFGFTHRD